MKEAKAAYAAKKAAEKTGASAREYLSISGLIMSWKDRCDAGGCGGRGNAREKTTQPSYRVRPEDPPP